MGLALTWSGPGFWSFLGLGLGFLSFPSLPAVDEAHQATLKDILQQKREYSGLIYRAQFKSLVDYLHMFRVASLGIVSASIGLRTLKTTATKGRTEEGEDGKSRRRREEGEGRKRREVG